MRVAAILIVISTVAGAAWQAAPSFDVTSVKPNTSGAVEQSGERGKGSLTMTNMRLRAVITTAYGIRPERIVGLPAWTDQERFDIAARAPAGTPDSELPLMLRTLLAERFRLVIRPEMREQPVYALVVARAGTLGPNLKPSTECGTAGRPGCGAITGSDGKRAYIIVGARGIDLLVRVLQGLTDRPVIDRTGLTGTYDFEVRFSAASAALSAADPANLPDLPSIFSAVQEQLGLRLEPATGPVEFLVVERIERPSPD